MASRDRMSFARVLLILFAFAAIAGWGVGRPVIYVAGIALWIVGAAVYELLSMTRAPLSMSWRLAVAIWLLAVIVALFGYVIDDVVLVGCWSFIGGMSFMALDDSLGNPRGDRLRQLVRR